MIKKTYIYESFQTDPYRNIAIEKALLEKVEPEQCILYLWQNRNTVVIGHNQNAWAECRTTLLEEEGGVLARRLSGGGAVFHDIGNLNFTFLVRDEDYDVDRQLSVIQEALKGLGIEAVKSGRNDLLVQERKFSGNAFYHRQGHAYHHGTLLVNVDMQKLGRYLTPPKAKLEAKGIQSVRSRVANLTEFAPELTCDSLRGYMKEAFAKVYGVAPQAAVLTEEELKAVDKTAKELSTWDWLYGPKLPFSFCCEDRFSWGSIQLQLDVESGVVQDVRVYSDAMDWLISENVASALKGRRFSFQDLTDALKEKFGQDDPICQDLCALLKAQSI